VPGEKTAYHPITYGFLAARIVRRACGRRSIGEFVQQELATPLAADFFIGLEPALQRRAAETLMPKNLVDPSALPSIEETAGSVTNPMLHPQAANTAAWRQAEMPALNGHASQRESRGSTRCSQTAAYSSATSFCHPRRSRA
jgi:CubicO group peptidase (beta-lactamase class C family)